VTIPYRDFTIAFTKAKAPPAKGLTELKKGALFPHIFCILWTHTCSDVNKDFSHKDQDQDLQCKDQDQDKDFSYKDQNKDQDFGVKDKDKDLSRKDKDKDKDFGLTKQTSNTDTNTRPTTITNSCVAAVLAQAQRFSMPASQITIN